MQTESAFVFFSHGYVCLFVLEFYGPVNNEVMSSRLVNSGNCSWAGLDLSG